MWKLVAEYRGGMPAGFDSVRVVQDGLPSREDAERLIARVTRAISLAGWEVFREEPAEGAEGWLLRAEEET
jgi:hypothetical protein